MIDQITWNILFEWITGTRCFLPEGCKPPVIGLLIYLVMISALICVLYGKFGSKITKIYSKRE